MTAPRNPAYPPVFIDYYPEQHSALVTVHECWGVDDGYACYGTFPTKAEAVSFAERRGWNRVIVRSDKPEMSRG